MNNTDDSRQPKTHRELGADKVLWHKANAKKLVSMMSHNSKV